MDFVADIVKIQSKQRLQQLIYSAIVNVSCPNFNHKFKNCYC